MRILHVITSVDPAGGGPSEGIRQLAGVLVPMGHTVDVVSVDPPDAAFLQDFPVPVHALGPGTPGYRYSRRLIPWLRQNAGSADVAIVHGLWQFKGFAAWRTLRELNVPYVLFTHGMLDPWFRQAYPLKHLKKTIYWRLVQHRILRDAKAVLFTCEEERLLARSTFRPFRCNEVVVGYGTSKRTADPAEERARFLDAHPDLRDRRLILFLGRIHPKKGCDLLIRAFAAACARDPRLHLVMAGPDALGWKAELDRLAGALGVGGRIAWTGMLTGAAKWEAIAAAEAFVLPSHQENFGIAVAEALSYGVPALISNKVNVWREIVEDSAGLVEADDTDGTLRLLERWLALSEAERREMRRRASACFDRRFDIRQTSRALIGVIGADRPSGPASALASGNAPESPCVRTRAVSP
jgi:glycosyltransferase involved in cell wall biosynthesis